MNNKEIENAIRELHQLMSLIDEATAQAEEIKDLIKSIMQDKEELRAGEYKVTWKHVTSTRLDTTALKKSMPDVAAMFTKTTTSRRFCLT